jgi:hypothetical protein
VKVFAVFALVFTSLVPCYADTQTWDVTASCNPQFTTFGPACTVPAEINAVFTTTPESGTFFNPVQDVSFTGTEPVVTSFSGTFNGAPITNVSGWMQGNLPGDIGFTSGGINYSLWWDGNTFFQPQNQFLETEYLNWSAIDPVGIPEPSTLLLLTVSLLLSLLYHSLHRHARRCSGNQDA